MARHVIVPKGMAQPIAPYSWATRAGNLIFVSGQAALAPDGSVVGPGDIRRQTEQTLENIRITLEAAGATFEDIVRTTVWITDIAHYAGMNEVYKRYFPHLPPARATLISGLVKDELIVEIDAIAALEPPPAP